jgi:hypothetical protein
MSKTTKNCLDCDKKLVDVGNAKKRCDSCQEKYRKLYFRIREKDPKRKEQHKQSIAKFRKNNPDKIKEYGKKYRNGKNRKYYLENKRKSHKEYYHNNTQYKLGHLLRVRLWQSIKKSDLRTEKSTIELLGCSKEEFMQYLETKFSEGMNWDNWSLNGWHIDHIRPISSFDLSDPEQVKECFHYSNLQPLWAIDNLKKSDLWDTGPNNI